MSEKKSLPPQEEPNFEAAFARLEQILERMNSGQASLDESVTLYEEANQLIIACSKRLAQAERRVEVLMKNRNGELTVGADQRPTSQDFAPPS